MNVGLQSNDAATVPVSMHGWAVQEVAQCASTNDLMLELAQSGAPARSTIVTTDQRRGRGRRGHGWISLPGESLACSVLWSSRRPQAQLGWLPLSVGIALAQALRALTGAPILLKWPNDLICEGAKLAGILVESVPHSARDEQALLVVGIGINLHGAGELSRELARPIADLATLAGRTLTVHEVLDPVLHELAVYLDLFEAGDDPNSAALLRQRWSELDALAGWPIDLMDTARAVSGVAVGVALDGALQVLTEQGIQTVYSGEVSVRRSAPAEVARSVVGDQPRASGRALRA